VELGKGTSLSELITVIRFPGYTTPAEFAFTLIHAVRRRSGSLEAG